MKIGVLFFLCLSGLFPAALAQTGGEIGVGGTLPDAVLNGLAGHDSRFVSYRGKPLIINVWASWCGPCRAEMGSLQRLARRYGGKKFNVIGISTDDDRQAALSYVRRAKISFETFIDHDVLLETLLGARTIPLTVLVDADGRVLRKIRGAQEWDSPEMLSLIGETLGVGM